MRFLWSAVPPFQETTVNIQDSSQLTVTAAENLGTTSVSNSGTLMLNNTTDWQLANNVRGTGDVRKTGSGSLTVGSNTAQSRLDRLILILMSAH